MKERKSIILSKDKSMKILEELLNVFCVYSNIGGCYRLSYPIKQDEEANEELEEQRYYNILKWKDNVLKIQKYKVEKEDDVFMNNTYEIMYNDEEYRMNIYDSPECCGYNSILKNYDKTSYHFVQMQKMSDTGRVKYEVSFGFDIVTMKLLELFEIDYINCKELRRECENIDEVEKEFKGRKLIA